MAVWVDWALWEKLSVILVMLIAIVFMYAFCALMYNRWMIRRYTAAETRQKEEEAEIYPMLIRDDVPFGVRALQAGVQVEDIWISTNSTPNSSPLQPGTPTNVHPEDPDPSLLPLRPPRPANPMLSLGLDGSSVHSSKSLPPYSQVATHPEVDIVAAGKYTYETQLPGGVYTPVMKHNSRESPSTFRRRSDLFTNEKLTNEKRASFHSRVWRASHVFDSKSNRTCPHEQDEFDLGEADGALAPGPPTEQRRVSRMTKTLRRRSSEEFRRKMSQIFNERIHMNGPDDQLQLNPVMRDAQRRTFRRTLLGPFRNSSAIPPTDLRL